MAVPLKEKLSSLVQVLACRRTGQLYNIMRNLFQNMIIFIKENVSENVICKMAGDQMMQMTTIQNGGRDLKTYRDTLSHPWTYGFWQLLPANGVSKGHHLSLVINLNDRHPSFRGMDNLSCESFIALRVLDSEI